MDQEIRRFWGWSYSEFVDQLLRRIPTGAPRSVLDIATGTGLIPRRIALGLPPGGRVVGLDLTFTALQHGCEKTRDHPGNSSIQWVQASAHDLPFLAGSFDLVICALAAHHLRRASLLAQAYRVLKPGGGLVLADVAASPRWKLPGVSLALRLFAFGYFVIVESPARAWVESEAVSNIYTGREWETALRQLGFSELRFTWPPVQRRWAPAAVIISARKTQVKETNEIDK